MEVGSAKGLASRRSAGFQAVAATWTRGCAGCTGLNLIKPGQHEASSLPRGDWPVIRYQGAEEPCDILFYCST